MPPVGSVYRNPGRWRAVIHQQEIRHSTAGCLLSVVLFAPLFVRCYGVAPVAGVTLFYSVVVVPTLAGYYSLSALVARTCRLLQHRHTHAAADNTWYSAPGAVLRFLLYLLYSLLSAILLPVAWLLRLIRTLAGGLLPALTRVVNCVAGVPRQLLHSVACLRRHTALMTTAKQLSYLLLLENALLPDLRLMALYHLMAFNILLYITRGYTVGQQRGVRSPLAVVPGYVSGTGWFMAARLAKATVVSTVLSAAAHQHLHVNGLYSATGGLYCVLTQHTWTGEEQPVQWLTSHHATFMDEEEQQFWILGVMKSLPVAMALVSLGPHLYYTLATIAIPAFTHSIQGQVNLGRSIFELASPSSEPTQNAYSLSSIMNTGSGPVVFPSVTSSAWPVHAVALPNIISLWPWLLLAGAALAFNVILPTIQLWEEYLLYQQTTGAVLLRLKRATIQDCARQETCAVCLEPLLSGRVTSCGHVYHNHCLRSLLTTHHTRCPLCNRNI